MKDAMQVFQLGVICNSTNQVYEKMMQTISNLAKLSIPATQSVTLS